MIQVENLVKRYGTDAAAPRAVNDVSFTVGEGGFYTLLGPSGCGKTTTLRSIAGLERPTSGTIRLGDVVVNADGMAVPTHSRDIGMVFQNYAVWPHMNVFDNVAFPLRVERGADRPDRAQVKQRVERALEIVGLGGYEHRMSTQLSGGQQQRLSFARAIVREPRVLLLDEPLSNLDAKLRERMRRDLKILHHELGITALFVTHDQVEALSMSDRIGVMRAGQIVQEGTPEDVYHRPENEFVATFIGSTNLIRGTVLGVDGDQVTVDTPLGPLTGTGVQRPAPGDRASVAIRPEDVVIRSGGNAATTTGTNQVAGTVRVGMFAGSYAEFELLANEVALSARSNARAGLDIDRPVVIELPAAAVRVFSGDGLSADVGVSGGEAVVAEDEELAS